SALLSSDDAVRVGASPGNGKREKLPLSQPRKVKISGDVPSPSAIHPLVGPAPTPPKQYQPYEPGRIRRWYNDAKAEVADVFRGSPIAYAEGERAVLPNPAPIYDAPGSDQSVNVRLPKAGGVNPA